MNEISLVEVSPRYAEEIEEYIAEFPAGHMQATPDPDRIPGLDHLEEFAGVSDWLSWCARMSGKITWYMAVRRADGRIVGSLCFRHRLEYDDDDPEFASHFGYSVRPGERRKGYATEQLRLGLEKAKEAGLKKVRVVCRDINVGSNRVIQANGGVFVDAVHGEESGMTIHRYDIPVV